jgi:Tol biopolymer transport system component/DNA-binding winged helix-turn-helix (wHTH) protein
VAAPGHYRFGPYEIHTRTRELYKYGTKLKLRPQPFQVLRILVEHAGNVVTREELRRMLWPAETFVDFEHGLNTSIKELRGILSDSAHKPRYIETLPKLGYRMVAPVEAEPPSDAPPNGDVQLIAAPVAERPKRPRRVRLYGTLAAPLVVVLAGWALIRRPSGHENSLPLPLTSFAGLEHMASWSPDGRQFAFMWNGEKQDKWDIYLQQPGSSHTQRLTTEAGMNIRPAWSPDGKWIAYGHAESRWGRDSLNLISPLGGPIRTVFANQGAIGRPAWTPDGRALIIEIIPAPRRPAALWAVWVDTGRCQQLTSPPAGIAGDTAPAISPDGKTLAFCRTTMWRTSELYFMDLKRDLSAAEAPRRVTNLGFVGMPAWTPDGSGVVFEGHRDGVGLFQMDRSGRNLRPIVNVPQTATQPALARRSGGYTSLVFTNTTTETSIWRYGIGPGSGGPAVQLAPSSRGQGSPRYSHDGNRLAFGSDRTGYQEIWVANADGSQPVQLTDLRHILTEAPDWSPSDDLIAFVSQDGANRQIYVVSTSGGPATAITTEEGVRSGDGWSRDGSAYYYTSTRSGHAEVWRVPRGGGRPQQMTVDGGICGFESSRGVFYYWQGESAVWGSLFRRTTEGYQPVSLAAQGVPCRTAQSPKGFYFKAADTGDVYLYDEAAESCTRVARRPDRPFTWFTVSPDSNWLAINFDGKQSSDLMIVEHFR